MGVNRSHSPVSAAYRGTLNPPTVPRAPSPGWRRGSSGPAFARRALCVATVALSSACANQSPWPGDAVAYIVAGSRPGVSLASPSGDGERTIAYERARIERIRWSPDGSSLAVAGSGGTLSVFRADGSSTRRLIDDDIVYMKAWSPDGARIAFAHPTGSASKADAETLVVELETGIRTVLLRNGVDPTWSPDGRSLAFERCVNLANGIDCDIWRADADGTHARAIVTGPTIDMTPVWSSDGRHVAFERLPSGASSAVVGLANADGSDAHVLSPGLPTTGGIRWSPDSAHITYERQVGVVGRGTWIVAVDGANDRQFLASGCDLDWSPDGARIAYQEPCITGAGGVFVAAADGTNPRMLVERGSSPVWRPARR